MSMNVTSNEPDMNMMWHDHEHDIEHDYEYDNHSKGKWHEVKMHMKWTWIRPCHAKEHAKATTIVGCPSSQMVGAITSRRQYAAASQLRWALLPVWSRLRNGMWNYRMLLWLVASAGSSVGPSWRYWSRGCRNTNCVDCSRMLLPGQNNIEKEQQKHEH